MVLGFKVCCFFSLFFFLISWYAFAFSTYLGNFFKKNRILLFRILSFLSAVFSVIGIILFQSIDEGGFDVLIVPAILTVAISVLFCFKKKKEEYKIHLKKGEYEIEGYSYTDFALNYTIKNKIKILNDERTILLGEAPPNTNQDLDVVCILVQDNIYESVYFLADSDIKTKLKNGIDILISLYAILVFCITLSILDVHMPTPNFNINIGFILMPVMFFIFNFGIKISKHGKDVFAKIFYWMSIIFYIISLIGLVAIWFI